MSERYIERLGTTYNHRTLKDRRRVLVDVVLDEMSAVDRPRVLDVGCGQGITPGFEGAALVGEIAAKAEETWGLDPALTEPPAHGHFDQFRPGLAETADLPAAYFDVAYSYMVVEHVTDPASFFRAVARTLKPGGVFVLCTINRAHYFARIANVCHKLHVDELALRVVRGRRKMRYHFPVAYKCNTAEDLRAAGAAAGFDRVDVAYSEEGPARGFFKGPLKLISWMGERRRERGADPTILLNLFAVMRKREG